MKTPPLTPKKPKKNQEPMSEAEHLLQVMIADSELPFPHRLGMLREVLNNDGPHTEAIAKTILDNLGKHSAESVFQQKSRQLDNVLKEIREGPMRSATFVEMLPQNGSGTPQAFVLLDDGTEAYTIIPKQETLPNLLVGDRVVLDGKGRVLLHQVNRPLQIGDVAHFERRIDDRHVEITLRGGSERFVFLAAQRLMDEINAGRVSPGSALIVSARRSLAISAVPPQDGFSHYRFLDRGLVPNVSVEEHIGAPPRCINEVADHVRAELYHPEVHRQYKLRRCLTKLLCGVSGTGKSLAIAAIHRQLYEIMSEITGVPVDELPPRVFRIRQGKVLSMWLGESEKNWERALDEAEQLADEEFTTPDGRQIKLPVLIVLEEVDGMGRSRGQEAIQDRILSTVLQRLDPHVQLADRLIIVLATTNVPQLVDAALLRRVGASIEHFHRLKRKGLMAVLGKLTRDLPVASNNGCSPQEIRDRMIQELTAWLFSPNGSDPGLVELTCAGSAAPVIKHRRDFLTGALVDGAVQLAAREAAQAKLNGTAQDGITLEQLARAFDAQLRGIVGQLNEHNVGSYTDLPDSARVATLRRIPQPSHLSFEFHRP